MSWDLGLRTPASPEGSERSPAVQIGRCRCCPQPLTRLMSHLQLVTFLLEDSGLLTVGGQHHRGGHLRMCAE